MSSRKLNSQCFHQPTFSIRHRVEFASPFGHGTQLSNPYQRTYRDIGETPLWYCYIRTQATEPGSVRSSLCPFPHGVISPLRRRSHRSLGRSRICLQEESCQAESDDAAKTGAHLGSSTSELSWGGSCWDG